MADLIERDALLKDLRSECPESDVCINGEPCIECIVNRQPAVNRWIPCSERLPEESGTYLVWFEYYRYGDYDGKYATHGIGSFYHGRWAFINHETGWESLRVIAWMPLPSTDGLT